MLSSGPLQFLVPLKPFSSGLNFLLGLGFLVLAIVVIFDDVSALANHWLSRRAMLLYVLAELIVREQVVVWCMMK